MNTTFHVLNGIRPRKILTGNQVISSERTVGKDPRARI